MKERYQIRVCKKGDHYGEPGELIETINRVIWAEQIGNFNPIFCRYKKATNEPEAMWTLKHHPSSNAKNVWVTRDLNY